MKRILIPCLFIFFTVMACFIPGMAAPTPIPTFDVNQIPTMVVQTAQALAALSITPISTVAPPKTGGVAPITDTPTAMPTSTDIPTLTDTPTLIPTPTLVPVIGEAVVMMPFVIEPPTAPPPAGSTPEGLVIAELVPPISSKTDCAATNFSREAQVVELINAERAKAGLGALSVQDQLVTAAQSHSANMACNNYFNHVAPDGSNGGDRLTRAGYPWTFFGENIAAGYTSPEKVVQAWMASPSHKANILNSYYVEIGVGYAYFANSSYGVYWTVMFGKQ